MIGISPTSFNFGGELIGASSTAQPFTVSNTGTAALTITQIQSTSANFTETDNCTTAPVAPAGTCTINVTFAPPTGAAVGATSGKITITDNANGSPQTVPLRHGVGLQPDRSGERQCEQGWQLNVLREASRPRRIHGLCRCSVQQRTVNSGNLRGELRLRGYREAR